MEKRAEMGKRFCLTVEGTGRRSRAVVLAEAVWRRYLRGR